MAPQLKLFDFDSDEENEISDPTPKERTMRVFANDEIANALNFIPKAAEFGSLEAINNFYSKIYHTMLVKPGAAERAILSIDFILVEN